MGSGKGSEEDWKIEFGNGTLFIGKGKPPKVCFLMKPRHKRTMNKIEDTRHQRLLSTVGALTKMEMLSSVLVQKTCWGNILFLASVITFFAAHLDILIVLSNDVSNCPEVQPGYKMNLNSVK